MRASPRPARLRKPRALLAAVLAAVSLAAVAAAVLRPQQRAPAQAASDAGPHGAPKQMAIRAEESNATPPRDVRISVAVSGDLLPHAPIVQRASTLAGGRGYDFEPMLRPLAPLVRSTDLALCHLEVPLQAGAPRGYPRFRAPPELADAIKAIGWDACSTASNHTLDLGESGVRSTLRALERAGLAHTGAYRSAAGQRSPLLLRVRGLAVAFLSYTATTNGLPLPRP